MNITQLPYSVEIDGKDYHINKNGSFDVILDILELQKADDLSEAEKMYYSMLLFYDFDLPDNAEEAVKKMVWFMSMGEESEEGAEGGVEDDRDANVYEMVDDFPMYISAVNKVLGYDCREPNRQVHWWTFVGAFSEIDGESYYGQIINIRQKLKKEGFGKLEKHEKEFYYKNRSKIEMTKEDDSEVDEFMKALGFEL